jgi:hypothetical protein
MQLNFGCMEMVTRHCYTRGVFDEISQLRVGFASNVTKIVDDSVEVDDVAEGVLRRLCGVQDRC